MWRSKADSMVRENRLADLADVDDRIARNDHHRTAGDDKPAGSIKPLTPEQEAKRRDRRSDLTFAALGVTLGLVCALFPWYIFFNPDEFGVRAMRFGGGGNGSEPIILGAQTERVGAPAANQEIPFLDLELDLRSTGTAVKDPSSDGGSAAALPGVNEQPFPPPIVGYNVIQIANGRAMIEDDTGLFVVQIGSVLPDGAYVKAIEERDGRLVVVTDKDKVLSIRE
ncbi:MAG: hypothetical protein JNK47_14390 [Mesorhizobium sp.]|nr:hypothetical protein [Mesorhizobium sp.]MBL8578410.1 hypothetical protein [Mesorhizobium sp.]